MRRDDVEAVYRLTPLQEGMLYHAQNRGDEGTYVQQFVLSVAGKLDGDRLRQAWNQVTNHYPVLRTQFVWQGVQHPIQIVRHRVEPSWLIDDWSQLSAPECDQKLRHFLDQDRQQGFDLTRAPLIRFALFKIAARQHKVLWTFHHIVLDGWSGSQVLKEWLDLYRDPALSLPDTLPFKDFVDAARRQMPAADSYWQRVFPGPLEVTTLNLGPVDNSFAATAAFPEPVDHYLDRRLTQCLTDTARRYRVTANALVASAWALLLAHHVGRREIVFGMVCSGRSLPLDGIESTVGLTINTLPIRLLVDLETSTADWIALVHDTLANALRHEHASLAEIVKRTRTAGTEPLFDTLLAYENYPEVLDTKAIASGIEVTGIDAIEQGSTPLSLSVTPGKHLLIRAQFDSRKHCSTAIVSLLARLTRVLEQMATDGAETLAQIQPLITDELRQTIVDNNDTTVADLDAGTLHEVFVRQARLTPDKPALYWRGGSISFADLDTASGILASRLSETGVGVDSVVAVYSNRSPEAIVAILGILKTGAAFMPIDGSYPAERIRHMLDDSEVRLVLRGDGVTDVQLPDRVVVWSIPPFTGQRQVKRGDSPSSSRSSAAAYVIYTSGSTGTPKGVIGTHKGTLNRFRWMYQSYPFATGEVACQKTALSFVDSIWETLGPLLAGVPLLILSKQDTLSPPILVDALARGRVSRLVLVPSLLRVLLEGFPDLAARVPTLRLCVVSGEPVAAELARTFKKLMPRTRLLNLYGSSEVSADISCFDLSDWDTREHSVPIGRPIANNRLYLLNDQLQPLPAGVPGKIYAAGAGLALGYHRQPERTRERFLEASIDIAGNQRLFDSGDLGRWRADGSIDYLGRSDRQLKLRGVRIEPGEIESTLMSLPGVRTAIVDKVSRLGQEDCLTAWVQCEPGAQSGAGLLKELRRQLPPHLVPEHLLMLESIPLLPSGKVDRDALPSPTVGDGWKAGVSLASGWAPQQALTIAIAAMFERILVLGSVGEDDNFFDLGGASLSAMRLLSEIAGNFDIDLPINILFANPTPRKLSEVLLEDDSMPNKGNLVPIKRHGRQTPFFCIFGDAFFLSKHLPGDRPFYWMTPWPKRLQLARCPQWLENQSISEIAGQYLAEIRQVQPSGPYQLSGSCAGAVVAMEIARQLGAAGEEVALLALFDLPAARESRRRPTQRNIRDKLSAIRQTSNGKNYLSAVVKFAAKYSSHRLRLPARLSSLRVRYHILTGREMSLTLARRYTNEKVYGAVAHYQHTPYTGKTVLFRTQEWAGDENDHDRSGVAAAWTALFPTDLEVHTLGAPRHDDLFREPYVRELAAKLAPHLH